MLKVNPHPDYPPEEGRYIRGTNFSPVAVAIIFTVLFLLILALASKIDHAVYHNPTTLID